MSAQPKIRWNEQAQVFLGEYGNIRFGLTPAAAIILADALYQAVRTYRANRNPQDELGPACLYRYPGGAQCGYQEWDCMHEGSSSPVTPQNGRHAFKTAGKENHAKHPND